MDEWAGDEPIDVLINNAGLGTATVTSYNGLDHRYAGISSDEDVQKSVLILQGAVAIVFILSELRLMRLSPGRCTLKH